MIVKEVNQPRTIKRRGNSYLSPIAQKYSRLPFGHQEAFIEAFANVYLAAAEAIEDEISGRKLKKTYDFPTIDDGITGMAFIATAVKSSKSKAKWTKMLG